jgi:hypothetical protein
LSHSILLLSDDSQDQQFVAEIAVLTGLSLKKAISAQEAVEIIRSDAPIAIFVDTGSQAKYEAFESAIQNQFGLFSDFIQPNEIHFLSSMDLDEVSFLAQSPLFGNFILRNFEAPQAAARIYSQIVKVSLKERAFGLENLLKEGTKVQKIILKETTQKQQVVEVVKNYLLAAKFKARMASVIANAVDEILMNAMFDAPSDELGKTIYSSTPRSTHRKLEDKGGVEMQIGFDGEYVAITAIDYYGSLDKNHLLNHIAKVYKSEEYRVKTATASAGIGLATVFRSGGAFFFSSEKGVRTEVTVFFKSVDSFKAFKDQFRFISTKFYF